MARIIALGGVEYRTGEVWDEAFLEGADVVASALSPPGEATGASRVGGDVPATNSEATRSSPGRISRSRWSTRSSSPRIAASA